MQQSVDKIEEKIKTLSEIASILKEEKKKGHKIVQCHGVFDLLHPGHLRHFKAAKAKGDLLVVSVTPDRFVNKGPGRPAFKEDLRMEALASLEVIDYVVLNETPDAVFAIQKIQPSLYIKGSEYREAQKDLTGKILDEKEAVEAFGGQIDYTDEIVFSSSSLLNKHFPTVSEDVSAFLKQIKQKISLEDALSMIENLSDLNVLVIGDAIIDEYQYVSQLGQTGKGLHMVGRCGEREVFLGGSLIIANHLAQFAKKVTLVTAIGKKCPYKGLIEQHLDAKVEPRFSYLEESTTLIKKRYVLKDGKTLNKLFETYSGQTETLTPDETLSIASFLKEKGPSYDLVLACDFGNGFSNSKMIEAISDVPAFLALNAQINSGNRGYNVVTNYLRADYISLNEPELRLAAHDQTSSIEGIAEDILQIMGAKAISITQGVKGVCSMNREGKKVEVPPFTNTSVDRIGAGDSYLSLSSLCMAKGYSLEFSSMIGSIAAAMSVQMVGNQEPIRKAPFCKFLTRLMK